MSPFSIAYAQQETVIADFEHGRLDGWTITGNCWGTGPENARFAGRTLMGWQGTYFLSSAHPKAPGWDAGSGTGRALSPTFRISGDTITFLIGGGRQYGRCGVRLLVEGEEALNETGESPFQMRSVAWDVRPFFGKTARIEIFDTAATGTYAYVHVDNIVLTGVHPEPTPEPRATPAPPPVPFNPPPAPRATPAPRPIEPPRPASPTEPFPTVLGPRPPIAPYTTDYLSDEKVVVPMVFPLLGTIGWHNNYNDDRGAHRHTGIDIQAPKMHPIIAPFSGILGFKVNTFWIYGDTGYKCLGTHLNDDTPGTNDNSAQRDFMFAPNLRPGDRVIAGQLIGYVGNSGDATGPHLHFELFTPDLPASVGLRSPAPSLHSAQRLQTPRLNLSPMPPAPIKGEVCVVGCPRGFESGRRILILAQVARQKLPGNLIPVTAPRKYYAILTPDQVAELGGIEGIRNLPPDRCLTIYVTETKPGTSGKVNRIVIMDNTISPTLRQ